MNPESIEVVRVIRAPRPRLFAAWTDPAIMAKWFCPRELTVDAVEADARVGGAFRIAMRHGDAPHVATGTYREVAPPGRLVFTWRWAGPENPDTVVTVTLTEVAGGTEVRLRQEGVPADEAASHADGWESALASLDAAAGPRDGVHTGSCACGAVRFEARVDLAKGSFRCNCETCTKGRFWGAQVDPADFKLTAGTTVAWQSTNRHHFCGTCGAKLYGEGPGFVAINVGALDDLAPADWDAIPIAYVDGRHDRYTSAPAVSGYL